MTKIVLDPTASSKLHSITERVEIWDDTGRILGYFSPIIDPTLYEGTEPPFSEEELRERDQATNGRFLAEIMADLEKKA